MKPQFSFTKEKFQTLERAKQHKKCAELLRVFYGSASLPERQALAESYRSMLSWMALPIEDICQHSHKVVSDRYHRHLKEAGISLREHSFLLPTAADHSDASPFLPVTVYLDRLRSCHNIGSIIRTTEAFRLGCVVMSSGMADAAHAQVQNSAMGCTEWVSSHCVSSLAELPRPIIALETMPEATAYYDFSFPECFTLAVGNEEYGCSDELLAAADHFIHIPLYGRKNSLNVATAFAIVAAEIRKQV
ncbi:MAG: TrmH family RNA methyltransferase [Verrucomicrobia bacterium]|nr:TrmH family RNA methyltransferase [Verrucomicrobiota bacterium]